MASAHLSLVPLSLAYGSGLRSPILKEPQCGNIGNQIESALNCESSLVLTTSSKKHAAIFNIPDYSDYSTADYTKTRIKCAGFTYELNVTALSLFGNEAVLDFVN